MRVRASERAEAEAEIVSALPIEEKPSPNFGPRRGVDAPDLVILHYTNMPTAHAALDRLCDPAAEVSAHYVIGTNGRLWRLVAEDMRAWHAGVSFWGVGEPECLNADLNSRSIGIELIHKGPDHHGICAPFPEPQIATLERLLEDVRARHSIRADRVLGHSDVAPGRKIDPGEKFDWTRLARLGLARPRPALQAVAVETAGADLSAAFRGALTTLGYGDWRQVDLEDAFRRRWRPAALGEPLGIEDLQLALALAQTTPR